MVLVATVAAAILVEGLALGRQVPVVGAGGPEAVGEVVFAWKALNYSNMPAGVAYDPAACMLAGVKVSMDGSYFVSVPRWKPHVPATLARLDTSVAPPLLTPFPSWEGNSLDNPRGLRSVLGFEIDATNTLWALDQGKLVGYDVATGKVVFFLVFGPELASPSRSFLNDLVVDRAHGYIYISDSGIPIDPQQQVLGGLLVVDIASVKATRVLSGAPSVQDSPLWITINGDKVLATTRMRTGADGIALTHDLETVVFCPLTSHHYAMLPASVLRAVANGTAPPAAVDAAVVPLGDRGFASDGLGFSNVSALFLTSLEGSGIFSAVSPGAPITKLWADAKASVWPDTIGWDHTGNIVWTSNQLYKYMEGVLDYSEINFRIYRAMVGMDSYLAGIFPPSSTDHPRHHD
ncbi:major royal jelly protein [Thecamonas trahens ATCC 50062]|uniref:Major royal jelly protein n=1 Tax=Thecamonas trahens ATCC 50062 TaxID=461836 RepID=A0A0L0D7A2_THETB|nr:major royal jelly protein [Thecamonas trahens ATCC 50062]KNC48229.1 major royal jelly protein [Thecamonas trahens ATCC 50062]|eukprot:XP_013758798.1 major royal jelly protein [Thecamonas trahens ATCC 50062]